MFRAAGLPLLFLSILLVGCSSMDVTKFAGTTPEFKPERYFAGRTEAWGMFQDRFGTVRRTFHVTIDGQWDDELLTLDERFVYDDGTLDRRIWRIRKLDDHSYEGEADDVVGKATGRAYGRALGWEYDLRMSIGGSEWTMRFEDLMVLQDGDVLINVAEVSKFGLNVGRVTLFFRKPDAEAPPT
ncbi:MAG: DUF3833 domain-containing protein [Proteobacteria bacterium]|nr:DUF3833 domain-containing protein [Pseudomonadota bacterium]